MIERRIRLSYNFPWFPILRQTPGSRGLWENCHFVTDADPNADGGEFDAWVVYNNLPSGASKQLARTGERIVLILGEPPSRLNVNPQFVSQFSAVVTCDPRIAGPGVIRIHQALPWWVGLRRSGRFEFAVTMDFDDLDALSTIPKTREISIVCSTLAITPQHRRRLRFVRRLVQHFGERLQVYGDGFNRIEDKWNAIAPFRYHIVLENFQAEDYWTEKLSDCFLAGALPLYWGCPNIHRYFAPESLVRIDISRPEETIQVIERVLADDPYQTALPAIWNARRRVLYEYNLFPMITRILDGVPCGRIGPRLVRSESEYRPSLAMRLRRTGSMIREGLARTVVKVVG